MLQRIQENFAIRTRPGFTGAVGRTQGASFIAVNGTAIPCETDKYAGKATHWATFVIIAVNAPGFVAAPYKANADRKRAGAAQAGAGKETKPLTELTESGAMKFWTYTRKGMDKGDRVETGPWEVDVGTCLSMCFREEDTVQKAPSPSGNVPPTTLPTGVESIPALTLCEITLVPKSSDGASEGWGLSVRSVRASPLSLYSYAGALARLTAAREEAKVAMLDTADAQAPILRCIDRENVFFAVKVSPEAYTEHAEAIGALRVWNAGGDGGDMRAVDIPADVALRYTNAETVEQAQRLLDIAAAAGALQLLVFASSWLIKKRMTEEEAASAGVTRTVVTLDGVSEYGAVPVIDTAALLACVSGEPDVVHDDAAAGKTFRFTGALQSAGLTGCKTVFVDVGAETENPDAEGRARAVDCIVTGRPSDCSRAHPLAFVGGDDSVLWRGFFNTSPVEVVAGDGPVCPRRRKWSSLA